METCVIFFVGKIIAFDRRIFLKHYQLSHIIHTTLICFVTLFYCVCLFEYERYCIMQDTKIWNLYRLFAYRM